MARMINTHVVILKNFIPPFQLSFLSELNERVGNLKILLSTPMEPNRQWPVDWKNLDVSVQKNLTLQRIWNHPSGFSDPLFIHLPYDTIGQLIRLKPEVVISTELGVRSLLTFLYCRAINRKCRSILWINASEHTEQGRGLVRNLLRCLLVPQADAILVNGNSGARYLQKLGAVSERIFLAPYTVPTDVFSKLSLQRPVDDVSRMLIVGQLIERKGIKPFLNSISEWARTHSERKIELSFIGDGPLRDFIGSQQFPSNLKSHMLGNIKYENLPKIYATADLLAFPTLSDEWGVVVNEAMAAGLPVLGSLYSQAVEELVHDGENGWTFRPDHADELLQAIDQALSVTPERMAEMRVSARARALTITPSKVVDQFLLAINFVLSKIKN